MSINREDALAVISSANRLGVDPGVLAGLMELESNMDPNIIGGAGDNYRGLIQFGPGARQVFYAGGDGTHPGFPSG